MIFQMFFFYFSNGHYFSEKCIVVTDVVITLLVPAECVHTRVIITIFEARHEKTNILVSDLVRHNPGCTAAEDG